MKIKKMMALVRAAAMAFGLADVVVEIPQLPQQHLLKKRKELQQQKLLQKQQRLRKQKAVITGRLQF